MKKIILAILSMAVIFSLTVPAMAATTPFTDVPDNAWYAQDVADVQELGIIQGKGNGLFDPDGQLTIAQAITLAAKTRAHYNNETIPAVEGGSWYSGALEYAKAQGIISGTEFTNFDVSATRGEMAFLFANALPETEYKVINTITELPDVTATTPYSTEIFKLYNAGIVAGSDKYGTYHPTDYITRAQATAILNRVIHSENRKALTLEKVPVSSVNPIDDDGKTTPASEVRTLRWDDPTRPYAREGDIFIDQNNKEWKLTRDSKTGIVGYGQHIATDLGRQDKGQTVTDGGYVTNLSRPALSGNQYLVNPHTGEGHFNDEWALISNVHYPDYNATTEGELSKDKNFEWSTIMGGWNLVVAEKMGRANSSTSNSDFTKPVYTELNDGATTPRATPLTLHWDDPTRPYAREGDTFIAQDGTSYKLTVDPKTGVVGYGLPIAADLGRTENGQTVTDGGYVADLSRPGSSGNFYSVNPYTGEGHFNSQWGAISREYYPDYEGTKDGELSKDKNFVWKDFMGGWVLVAKQG